MWQDLAQDIALVEGRPPTFNVQAAGGTNTSEEDREPHHCVLLRAGGLLSLLDLEQGNAHLAY